MKCLGREKSMGEAKMLQKQLRHWPALQAITHSGVK